MDKFKLIAIILVIIAVLNILLFAFRMITPLPFWIIILLLAFIAYYGMPWLKEYYSH